MRRSEQLPTDGTSCATFAVTGREEEKGPALGHSVLLCHLVLAGPLLDGVLTVVNLKFYAARNARTAFPRQ